MGEVIKDMRQLCNRKAWEIAGRREMKKKLADMPTTTGKTLREELTELYGWYTKQAKAERDNRSPLFLNNCRPLSRRRASGF